MHSTNIQPVRGSRRLPEPPEPTPVLAPSVIEANSLPLKRYQDDNDLKRSHAWRSMSQAAQDTFDDLMNLVASERFASIGMNNGAMTSEGFAMIERFREGVPSDVLVEVECFWRVSRAL